MKNAVEKVIDIVGSLTKLAKLCGVRYQSVAEWRDKGIVPPKKVLLVAEIIDYKIPPHELNPYSHGKKAA
jgi:DNA-binding transcriptional regulator YdaS (Cro superfamily)